jgi:tetratricopeptide (TPR) repeat protein
MKNNLLLAVLLLASFRGFTQGFNVQSAADAFKDLQYAKTVERRLKDFSDAKKFIDEASSNEQTANDPKMWYYRGMIYLSMDQDTNEVIRNLDIDAIEKSAISFIKCMKADVKKNYSEECDNNIWRSGVRLYNKATAALNKGDYERASRYFNLTLEIIPLDKDNNLKRNTITPDMTMYYLAKSALRAKDNVKAKEYLQKLIDAKYHDPTIYLQMEKVYLEEKDTAKALAYIDQGRKIFDDNTALLNEEIHIYTLQGKIDELIIKFSDAINLNPDNEMLFYNRGVMYDQKKDIAKAESDYKKAIELKPDFMDANYALGVLYFNQAADLANTANQIKNNEEFEKAKKKYEQKFKDAAPYLEKALELNPKKSDDDLQAYKGTVNSLKQLYARTGELDKYNKMKTLQEQK